MRNFVRIGALGLGLVAPAITHATVVNFHDADQGYAHYGGYSVLMYGQGAASDPGNNVWNGFGKYPFAGGGPGSTMFYGGNNPDSGHGAVPNGNPGNPYAWYNGTSTSGANLFAPANAGASNVGNANSDGTHSPVTLAVSYSGGDNGINAVGAQPTVLQGTPAWILSEAALVSGTDVGTFTLGSVPAGTYDLYLYGANYDGNRGATFGVASGTPLGGFTSATNPGGGTLQTYVLGQDYVEFVGVTPDGSGNITGNWSAISNGVTGESGEGDFNGLQLVSVPEPASLAVAGLAGLGLLARRRRNA